MLWQDGGRSPAAGAGLLLSINGSPYEIVKHDDRLDVVRQAGTVPRRRQCPIKAR